ncbi:hypothetical protein BDN71DRAFT_1357162, partial [Pleurotus eryngii]
CLQQGSHSFVNFSVDMMGHNNLLASTDSFFNDEFLCDIMNVNMDHELAQECNHENIVSIVSFCDWLNKVKCLDERKHQRLEENERTLTLINAKTNTSCPNTSCPSFQPHNTNSPTASSTFVPMPKLTEDEHTLLSENSGCYKCQHFWAGHVGACCMAPFIDTSKYKMLTTRD